MMFSCVRFHCFSLSLFICRCFRWLRFFFIILFSYYWRKKGNIRNGQLFGWFLVACFGMRFLIEFIKEVQEEWEQAYILDMGQMLSIPFFLAGIAILILSRKKMLGQKDSLPEAGTPRPRKKPAR